MKKLLKVATALSLAVLIASPILADDAKKENKKGDKAKAKANAEKGKDAKAKAEKGKAKQRKERKAPSVVRLPKGIELSAEQQERVAAINAKYAGKLAELRKEQSGLLTAEQKQAKAEAIKAAREAGKKGAEFKAAVAEVGKPTAEQEAKAAEIKKAAREITQQAQAEAKEVLTKEQLASLRPAKKAADPEVAKKRGEARKAKADAAKKKRDVAKAEKKKADAEKK